MTLSVPRLAALTGLRSLLFGVALALLALPAASVPRSAASVPSSANVAQAGEVQVSGTIVDDEGKPVPFGRALVWGESGFYVEISADEAGEFQGSGLPPGRLGLRPAGEAPDCVSGGDSPPGETVEVELKAGRSLAPLTLRLGKFRTLRGRVTLDGQPVEEAGLEARIDTSTDPYAVTDEDGRFVLVVPAMATRATLMVNGGVAPVQAFEVALDGTEEIHLQLEPHSGSMEIALPASWSALTQRGKILVLETGGQTLPDSWIYEAEPESLKTKRLQFQRIAPGSYRACLGPAGFYGQIDPEARKTARTVCADGELRPGETLRLALPAPAAVASSRR
jgi:hypothetical protein